MLGKLHSRPALFCFYRHFQSTQIPLHLVPKSSVYADRGGLTQNSEMSTLLVKSVLLIQRFCTNRLYHAANYFR